MGSGGLRLHRGVTRTPLNRPPDHLNLNLNLWWWFLDNDIFIKRVLEYSKGLERLAADELDKKEEVSSVPLLGVRNSSFRQSTPLSLPGSAGTDMAEAGGLWLGKLGLIAISLGLSTGSSETQRGSGQPGAPTLVGRTKSCTFCLEPL